MYPAKPGILIGFHGCDKQVRDAIINHQTMMQDSKKDYNWLGRGLCLDLLEKEHIDLVKQSFATLETSYGALNLKLPRNLPAGTSKDLLLRKLDCAVIENLHHYRKKNKMRPFDSVRGVFIEGEPVYKTAGFYEKSHIQLCIRNPNCIKGFFKPREEDKDWQIP